MEIVKLKCKIITPMFMAEADGRTPELRSSGFKGMMRWWWRAMKAEDNIDKLKKEEAEIFGGTGKGEGRSRISIKIFAEKTQNGQNFKDGQNLKNDENLRWSFNPSKRILEGPDAGVGYILYSTVLQNKERSYIKAGRNFEIQIDSYDEFAFKNAIASLWLAIYLGGFGTRARRGGGNLEVFEVSEKSLDLEFICNAKSRDELAKWLQTNFEKTKNIIRQSDGTNKYTNLKGARILIFDAQNSWKEALNFLGEKYKDFRSKNKSQIFETAAFGMPVMHSGFRVRMVPYKHKNEKGLLSDRWASPLIFKVIKSNNLYFPVIIKLSGGGVDYIGKEIKYEKDWKLDNNRIQNFNEELVNAFLNSNSLPDKKELEL